MPYLVAASEDDSAPLTPLIYISFDGTTAADAGKAKVAVTGGKAMKFRPGKVGKGADFLTGGCLEYTGLPPINTKSGTVELWVKPAHDNRELEDHYYVQFFRDGKALMELKFYQVECSPQVTVWTGRRTFRRYGGGIAKDNWNHIVVTWDSTDPDVTGLHLYRNGSQTGYPAAYQPMPQPTMLRVGCKSPEEGHFAKAVVDEICIYNRSLTPLQVKALYEKGDLPLAKKVEALREQIALEDEAERRCRDLLFNHRKLGMLHGRFTSLLHWKDERFKPLGIPVPDKIHENDLAKTDLSKYDVLIVPGGGGLRLTDPNKEALLRYVREGGGYVGICGGAITAGRYGLVDAKRYPFDVRGAVKVLLQPHPITKGYDIRPPLLFPHASGPLWVIEKEDEQPVIMFRVGSPPLPPFAHTIAKQYGKGRVVVFSGHPESSPRTRRLLRNAIMWAADIIGVDDGKDKTSAEKKRR